MSAQGRVIVLGDLHGALDADDVAWINADAPDAVLVVGDLPQGWSAAPPACAAHLAALTPPVLWIPGNHDGVGPASLVSEALFPGQVPEVVQGRLGPRVDAVAAALGPVRRVGYEAVALGFASVLVGRPHTMGGPSLAFREHLLATYGVGDLDASAARMRALVDGTPGDSPVVWLAHNGPAGLGGARDSIFGRDFRAPAVDWGDPDLAVAVAASRNGRRPVVVVAGHMHHSLRGGGERQAVAEDGDLLVVNCAVVPRIRADGRHHVELAVEPGRITAAAVVVAPSGAVVRRPLGVASA